jgi:hypothetical protein
VTIDVDAGVAQDGQGNANAAATQKSQSYSGLSALGSVDVGCTSGGAVSSLAVSGNYVFTGLEAGGVKTVDASSKVAPSLIGTLTGTASDIVHSLTVTSGQLIVSNSAAGLKVFGLTDPTAPNVRDTDSVGSEVTWHFVAGSYAYYLKADSPRGIVPVNVSDPDNITASVVVK